MDVQFHFPGGTLSTEHQALVEALNRFLAVLPDDEDREAVVRLVMELLELADVASQEEIARAAGYSERTLRLYKQRLHNEGLGGLFDHPIPGRPAVTTQPAVEGAVVQAILEAVITQHTLPDDAALAEAVNRHLAEKQDPLQVSASMVETIRLGWGIKRLLVRQQLQEAQPPPAPQRETVHLGRTRVGGAFILAVLLVEEGLLRFAHLLSMAPGYAVTSVQWLLTAIFSVIWGIERAFHLDDVRDIGFALLTGRPRPLSHSTFQHLQHAIPGWDAIRFYLVTARQAVRKPGEGTRRISLDGHVLPRYTKLVELAKGRIASTGRVLKAEELISAFDLDAESFLALRVRQGGKNLTHVLLALVKELCIHRRGIEGLLRFFFDRGGYKGLIFEALSKLDDVHFYTPAVRYPTNVEQWEALTEEDFEPKPFVFDKHADLPSDERPRFRLADITMEINVWEGKRLTGTVEVRAIVVHDPQGQTSKERWPFVLLTDDWDIPARELANEWGDHWGHEFAHRIGKHDLCLDILPPGYTLITTRDEQGRLQRQVEYDTTSFFLSAWLRCLVFNLMTLFGQALGGECANMWAGTLLRKFIRRPATLYLVGKELHVVFDPFPGQEALRPLLEELNAKRVALPWLNGLVVQFSIAQDKPLHPLTEPQKRQRLFGDG
jgi:transposase